MLFNSWQYVLFLPLVAVAYYLLPHRARWVLLLFASYYFYMSWNAKLVVLIFTTTFVSYAAARLMDRESEKKKKRRWLWLAALVSLGILFFFKYFDFASTSLAAVMARLGLPMQPFTLGLVLPVGISFYTFQTLGYVVDVYRGDIAAERHFGIYALFVSFFPQLVAGPIERAGNLLPQFREEHAPQPAAMAWGLRMICWGLLKKAVIADTLAIYVNAVYGNLDSYTPMAHLVATVLFAVQILCDFSGYTDIARGSAAILGFSLMENFNAPYLARSMKEFWKRWHVSLSTWFMDYVYIPLGGSRVGVARHVFNLVLTFGLSGLWHGARWNFVAWGLYHGVLVALDVFLLPPRQRMKARIRPKVLRGLFTAAEVAVTFALVCIGWAFFRAVSLAEIWQILSGIPAAFAHPAANLAEAFASLSAASGTWLRMGLGVLCMFGFDWFVYRKQDPFRLLAQRRGVLRAGASYLLALAVIAGVLSMPEGVAVEFIYFQF